MASEGEAAVVVTMTMDARQRRSLTILEAMTIHTADNAKQAENN